MEVASVVLPKFKQLSCGSSPGASGSQPGETTGNKGAPQLRVAASLGS
jgi:hypothetical protein